MKRYFALILLVFIFINTSFAQDFDEDGCPLIDGQIDPHPGLPAICYEKLKGNPGPGFPGNANPIEIEEVIIKPENPLHPLNPLNPWYPYISVPVFYPTATDLPKDPCDLLKNLIGKQAFEKLMNKLRNGAANDNFESGGIFYGDNVIDIKGKSNMHSIEIKLYDKITGIMHNHVQGGYSIFSYADMLTISKLYTSRFVMNPKSFFFGVTTHQKTDYILTIENIELFEKYTKKMNESVAPGLPYEFVYDIFVNKNNSITKNLEGFLQYLNIENTGLKLFEYDSTKKEWIPKILENDGEKNNVKSNPCK